MLLSDLLASSHVSFIQIGRVLAYLRMETEKQNNGSLILLHYLLKILLKKTNKIYLHIIHLLSFLSVNRATFSYYNYLFISIDYNSTFNPRKIKYKTKVNVKFVLNNKKKYFTLLKYKTYYSNDINQSFDKFL